MTSLFHLSIAKTKSVFVVFPKFLGDLRIQRWFIAIAFGNISIPPQDSWRRDDGSHVSLCVTREQIGTGRSAVHSIEERF